NVLPFDRVGRLRGGKRPGTVKQYPDPLVELQNVQMIAPAQVTAGSQTVVPDELIFNDGFNYPDGDLFTVSSHVWYEGLWVYTFVGGDEAYGRLIGRSPSNTKMVVTSGEVTVTHDGSGSAASNTVPVVYQPPLALGNAYVIRGSVRF